MIDFSFPATKELILAFAQVQGNVGTTGGFFDHFNRVIALATGFPANRLIGFKASATGKPPSLCRQ